MASEKFDPKSFEEMPKCIEELKKNLAKKKAESFSIMYTPKENRKDMVDILEAVVAVLQDNVEIISEQVLKDHRNNTSVYQRDVFAACVWYLLDNIVQVEYKGNYTGALASSGMRDLGLMINVVSLEKDNTYKYHPTKAPNLMEKSNIYQTLEAFFLKITYTHGDMNRGLMNTDKRPITTHVLEKILDDIMTKCCSYKKAWNKEQFKSELNETKTHEASLTS